MPPKKRGRPPGSKNKVKKETERVERQFKVKNELEIEIHQCSKCQRDFQSIYTLRLHEKKCYAPIEKKLFITCKDCNKKFRFKQNYIVHCLSEHSTAVDSVACDKCSVRCPDIETLKNHIDNVHNREIFECEYCKKKFVRRAHVLRHMAQKGCDGNGVSEYPCEICTATFTRKDNLIVHLRLQHIFNNYHKCKQCSFHTRNFNKLISHVKKVHLKKARHFECDNCGKVTQSRSSMIKHLEIHGDKKYDCDVCGYSTYTIQVMRRHILTHVEAKPFKCRLCDKSYIQRMQLERHLAKHTENTCLKCDKSFNTKASLLIHMNDHNKVNTLSCPNESCDQANTKFLTEAALENHLKTHTQEKMFKCDVCSKSFYTESYMRRHVSTHTLDRPRRCMYCVSARAYVRGEQLIKHVRKHHTAVFRSHLSHVREVLGISTQLERVKKSELESILNVLDAEAERILEGYGEGVLYGGMQEVSELDLSGHDSVVSVKNENAPLMSEEELAENLGKLLSQLLEKDMLECFGWPNESVDEVLEKVIEQCGSKAADRERWTRVQRLRENTKYLFLHVIEDQTIAKMLDTHTIDQIIKHILSTVTDDEQSQQS